MCCGNEILCGNLKLESNKGIWISKIDDETRFCNFEVIGFDDIKFMFAVEDFPGLH